MDTREFIDLKKIKLGGKFGRRKITLVGLALLALMILGSSVYQVGAESVGVVLRLGKYHRTQSPGLNMKLPLLESVYIVEAQRQLKLEFGFRTLRNGAKREFVLESLMLTGDLNVASVEWSVLYRIIDPFKYLFRVRNVTETFRDMTQAVMREIVGDRTVNEVLTIGRTELAVAAHGKLQELCDQYETGIQVDQVILQDINPPDPVKPSFNEVNQAQQERERLINEARAEYNLEIPRARGEADQTIRRAEGYAIDRVNRSKGEADRFGSLYAEYRKAPEVTRRRIYIETLNQVLPKVGKKLIVDPKASNIVPLLQLGKGDQ